ncbi:hypothetical protein [Acinetobacter sp. Marseille-Q1618]|uniref:hypothetical protein n=1 Tax=Acinetobacter sp. Marseille-Q1618 TaxID=2697502 RepID=UPI00156F455A|nr:hypothetical protein [Acinetobacter sp. Marseille-Q1618]
MITTSTNSAMFVGSDNLGTKIRNIQSSTDLKESILEILSCVSKNAENQFLTKGDVKRGYVISLENNNVISITTFLHKSLNEWFEISCFVDFEENEVYKTISTEKDQDLFNLGDDFEFLKDEKVSLAEFLNSKDIYSPSNFELLIGIIVQTYFPNEIYNRYSLKEIISFAVIMAKSFYDNASVPNITMKNLYLNAFKDTHFLENWICNENEQSLMLSNSMELFW